MTSLNAESLRKQLAGKMIGHRLYYYDEIGSTNDEAFRLGEEGAPEGTVLIAESQTSGKAGCSAFGIHRQKPIFTRP